MENYSLLMGDSSVDGDGGGVDGGAFRGTSPPGGVPEQRLLSPRSWLRDGGGSGRKRTPDDAEELLARIGRNHDDWSTPEPTPTPILKKRGMIKLNDEDMREAKKSLKEKGIKSEDVKNLPPIEDSCKITPPSSMIEDPLYPEGHPKRVEQDSQRTETSAPSKKKKKKHKTVVESSEPVNDPNSISISDAETESGNEHDKDNDKNDASDKEEVEEEPEKHAKNKKYTKEDFIAKKHGSEREPWVQKQMPFPAKKLKSKEEEHYNKFCDWMKPLFLQIPLTDAIKLPPYSKYMKDIVSNKRKIPNEEISTMLANYSFNGKVPKKLGDPGTARKIEDNPKELLELYRGITNDDCRTIQRGKIRNIQLPAIKYFAYYIGTSILGRENTSNISSYHLGFLIAALTGDTPYHLGALVARRLSNKGPIFGGIIASRVLAYLELPLDPNDVKITPMRLDIAAMKSHQFVTTDSSLDKIVYRILFADGEEREILLPQPDLFSIDRKPWSRTKEEVDEQLKIQGFHQQHDSEDAEPSYDYTVTYPGASSSTYPEYDPSSSYYGGATSWAPWD
ncbi:hypothetical protein QYE76_000743 [Lolium multiflorum]|uniref:Uncharacterized protein n=1 Tax=Lolium multiflorum TaxID=4521 RepID=A0AAD8RIC9_LOLMU|nr:hypothetical protein QYE76_000743 [Lolium multiflorum]